MSNISIRSSLKYFTSFLIVVSPFFSDASNDTTYYYISKNGNDENPGTFSKPVAGLERARDLIRQSRTESKVQKPVVVYIRKGVYFIDKSFELTESDAATVNAAVVYKAYQKEYVEFNGGIVIPPQNATKVSEKKVLDLLPKKADGKIYKIDLFKLGIYDVGTHHSTGFRRPYYASAMELFINKDPLHVSRYPNDSNILINKVIDANGTIQYNDNRPKRWLKAKNAWMGGTFDWAWADDEIPVSKIDTLNRTISTIEKSMFNFESGQDYRRWYVFNLLEEIDAPGEYYIDKEKGILYFYPFPGKLNLIEVSILEKPMLFLKGVSNVSFQNINFENMRGIAVYMEEGENNSIKNCTFRNIGMVPVVIGRGVEPFKEYLHNGTGVPASGILGSWHEHIFDNPDFDRRAGKNNGIESCKIYNAGCGGVSLGGGNRKTLEPAGNYVINSDIHYINRLGKTYKGAVNVDGVGNTIRGNHLHNTTQIAIYLHGNDHVIEYNEIDSACQQAEDMGAIYMGRDPSETGYSIRYNYFHDILPKNPSYRLAGIYFDDGSYGQNIYGNIFYKVGNSQFGAIFIHGGHDFVIQNNVFVQCARAIGNVSWSEKQWNTEFNSEVWQTRLYKKVNIEKAPYNSKYPQLAYNLKKSSRTSKVINNISIQCKEFSPEHYTNTNNYITDSTLEFIDAKSSKPNMRSATSVFKKLSGFENLPIFKMTEISGEPGNPFDSYKNFTFFKE